MKTSRYAACWLRLDGFVFWKGRAASGKSEGIKQRLCVLGECALDGYGQIFFPAIGRAGKSARHLDFLPDQYVDTPPQDELGLEL
jgi:hypothetical protein